MLSKITSAIILVLFVDMVLTKCPVGCLSCFGKTCTSCESSYFLSNGGCLPCYMDCESCSSYNYCTSCKPSKYGVHARCPFNCDGNCVNMKCHDDTGYCAECLPGFYGLQCQHNCSLCKDELCDLRVCSKGCRNGYYEYVVSAIETICQRCPSNCKQCTDSKTCYICDDGFYLYAFNDNVYCVSCPHESKCLDYCVIQGCDACQIRNYSLVCINCAEGQVFNGNSCESIKAPCSQNCSTYCNNIGICQGECKDGWTGEKCLKACDDKCSKCSRENEHICKKCKDDYYSVNCSLVCNPSCKVEEDKKHMWVCRRILFEWV
ncbi:proprotein convertase subtilisin/kexin type 5-like [Ruditapes philippinarum]|uniref:proprotein convertase subtilisin/kexin type 5-like n=1 Tax=Ruditapes philippinarum TaxID=129788 RepID=UPI00295B8C23|nr:proprotein convertase subtilisin/kexin type 5-like [Ruditapes philippinarum]